MPMITSAMKPAHPGRTRSCPRTTGPRPGRISPAPQTAPQKPVAGSAAPLQDIRCRFGRVESLVTTDPYVTSVRAVPSTPDAFHRDRGHRGDTAVRGCGHARSVTTVAHSPSRPSSRSSRLTGIGGGETVREVHQDTPFSLVALTAADLSGTSARVRAKKSDGSWGPWYRGRDPRRRRRRVDRTAWHRTGLRRAHHHRADRGDPPGRRTGIGPAAAAGAGRPAGPWATSRPTPRAAVRAEHQRGAHQPADSAARRPAAAERGRRPRPAAQHHHPRTVGRRRIDEVPADGVRRRGSRRHRAPHRGQQRLLAAGLGGHRQIHLRVPHPHLGLVRHRLQRAGRQVRPGLRGAGRRHHATGRGRAHGWLQQEHLGRGDARQLRGRAADAHPDPHGRTAAGLATRP